MYFGCAAAIEDIEVISRAGYDYVELGAKNICLLDRRELKALSSKLEKLGLPCLVFNRYCPAEVIIAGPGFDEREAERYAANCLPAALALGVQSVGIGSPSSRKLPKGFNSDLAQRQMLTFLRITADVFGQKSIDVCLESLGLCYCNCVNYTEEAVALVQELRHPHLKLVADFYNMEHSGEGDLDLAPYLPLLRHIHLSDDLGQSDQRSLLRQDRYPVHRQRLQRLRKTGYDATVSLEVDIPLSVEEAADNLHFLRETCA